ncbi:MAG: 7-cyano-7-deazaguanine synthase QueC, partial [Ignavibacteria bacterium]|nr:7-cyano-7-deazaguanine synthase QueC [Ignavibacteria bacterium]
AKKEGYEIAALHLNYGQRTQSRELKAFNDLLLHFQIKHKLVVDVSHFANMGGSSLTDNSMEVTIADLDNTTIPTSYVPFRNGNILSVAASWTEVLGANAIFIGANQLDSSGYPDCRKEFFDSFENSIELGTKPETKIKILTPIINFSKKKIVEIGIELGTPFQLTWSCYKETECACGLCDSCGLRLRGFAQAGKEDPIKYLTRPEYL